MEEDLRFIDYDARREPKTDLFCVCCQKDLDPSKSYRIVYSPSGESFARYPDKIQPDDIPHPIGLSCARKLGLDWTVEK